LIHLFPLPLCPEHGFQQRRVIDIQNVWANAYNRAMFLMKPVKIMLEVTSTSVKESPKVGKLYNAAG